MRWLHDGAASDLPPKAAALAQAAAAGLPVPRGLVVPLDGPRPTAGDLAPLRGDVIARSAFSGEDTEARSAAGLGLSVPGLRGAESILAGIDRVDAHRSDPFLVRYRGVSRRSGDAAIVQRQVPGDAFVVAALTPEGHDFIEVHATAESLSVGSAPTFAGSVQRYGGEAGGELARVLTAVRRTLPAGPHGTDAELVVRGGDVSLVQVRPLTRPLSPGWPAFAAELDRLGQRDQLDGTLVLDAEHNPAPLSPAHAWLMEWLATQRPSAGQPVVVAGWLFVRTLVRDLSPSQVELDPVATLGRLQRELIPGARRLYDEIVHACAKANASETAALLDRALAAFVSMIDAYLQVIVPARAGLKRAGVTAVDADAPLCLRDRSRFADVLPVAWDVASPTLSESNLEMRESVDELPTDPIAAATLLTEWDDHLFALGLAPLRRTYQRAGTLLSLGDDVFLLRGDEVQAALRGASIDRALIDARAEDQGRFELLRPPARIEDGRPVPAPPGRWLRGIPIGESFEGPLVQRRDLADLLARPPAKGDIVSIPALTAQAAIALQHFDVRAVCCEFGGAMSHATLMARELGLSALIGCHGCTTIPNGTHAILDTTSGRLLPNARVEPD